VPIPIQGLRAEASVQFGNTTGTVVATPRVPLSSSLSGNLPWIVLGAGIAITLASVAMIEYVGRRRRQAEVLARELRRLHAEQRSIATTLQHALLPESVPEVSGLELAAHYLPGTQGVEVGGDWYDFVPLDNERLVFVVGDVSGRGVRAASVMASLRFAGHGFALEGHPPHMIIERLRTLLDLESDGYFATVLCGLVDVSRHELLLSNAGHPPPVLCSTDGCKAVSISPSPPIGVTTRSPDESTTVSVPPLSTIVAYTDGLIERRDDTLSRGIERLEHSAAQQQGHLDGLLESIIGDLTEGSPSDDVAVIGVRWLK
jgi:serine phosphatase RsbU (regulator of sigma subunit)